MTRPFLSVITRHLPTRPKMLAVNRTSLLDQSDVDYEQLVFTDEEGLGNVRAQKWLVDLISRAKGRYILILDDDDLMVNKDGIRILKEAAAKNPRAILFKALYGSFLGTLPYELEDFPGKFWAKSHIGQLCYVLRNDIFQESRYVYQRGLMETDYLCVLDAWENAKCAKALDEIVLLPDLINAAQRPESRGAPE